VKKILLGLGFIILVLVSAGMGVSAVLGGEKYQFTLDQLFAPTIGAFAGAGIGAGLIIIANAAKALVFGISNWFDIARIFTLAFAAYYFAQKKEDIVSAVVPLGAMALFVLHPVGREAWFFSLFWLIPVVASFYRTNLLARSFGSTFTAHSIGTVAFLYTFSTTPAFWIALIPIVVVERLLFGLGISASFLVVNQALCLSKTTEKFAEKSYALF